MTTSMEDSTMFSLKHYTDILSSHNPTITSPPLYYYADECSSTMDIAQIIQYFQQPFSIVLAEQQSAGKGTKSRSWHSSTLGNIYCSFVIRQVNSVNHLEGEELSSWLNKVRMSLSASVCHAIRSIGCSSAFIKWPNDILLGQKKACGILQTASNVTLPPHTPASDELIQAIKFHCIHSPSSQHEVSSFGPWSTTLGFGINVNSVWTDCPDKDGTGELLSSKATSVRDTLGREVSREEILAQVVAKMTELLSQSREQVRRCYLECDGTLGKVISVFPQGFEKGNSFLARAEDYTLDGQLLASSDISSSHILDSEEVSIRFNQTEDSPAPKISTPQIPLTFQWSEPGSDFSVAKSIRRTVFVDEQKFSCENEFDATDALAYHVVGFSEGQPACCARVFFDGDNKTDLVVGRVAVMMPFRKGGTGRQLMNEVERKGKELGATRLVLGAQKRIKDFYLRLGYQIVGEEYFDEYCAHLHMVKEIEKS
ncbi:putative GNAT family N-acetyltransferase [Blattamonas nauphoetae]|uniref:GNAT family N-acetyltransferase n=1 Tax=Blattamonas nauphoetae TaxID=2049346 RepID=A0ABQ9XJE6_9EUKA|nr:putative GNAT family N-acetyltransferase [Blattamonas nauphoetae]